MLRSAFFAAALSYLAGAALASPIAPTFTSFENLPGATFGGSGIPTDPTAITRFTASSGDNITLGLAATPRFDSEPLGNDGNGTYFAKAGSKTGGPSNLLGALWNFSFYIHSDGAGGGTLADLGLRIFYDFDPGIGTNILELGILGGPTPSVSVIEGSQNLLFGFLNDDSLAPAVIPPLFDSFDPNAAGEYTFAIESTAEDQRVAINVVVSPVPLPAGLPLALGGFAAFGLLGRRRRRRS